MLIRSLLFLIAFIFFIVWGYVYFVLGSKGLIHILLILSNMSLLVGILYRKRLS